MHVDWKYVELMHNALQIIMLPVVNAYVGMKEMLNLHATHVSK
jgi:hypothetical protein